MNINARPMQYLKCTTKHFAVLMGLGLTLSVVGALLGPTETSWAWCRYENTNIQETVNKGAGGCFDENYRALPDDAKKWLDQIGANEGKKGNKVYQDLSEKCENGPGTVDGGACMNAVRSCLSLVIDKSICQDAGNQDGVVDAIADACSNGIGLPVVRLGDVGAVNPGDDCAPISVANEQTIITLENSLSDKVSKVCDSIDDTQQRVDCTEKYFQGPATTCAKKAGLDMGRDDGRRFDFSDDWQFFNDQTNNRGYNDMKLTYDEYNSCIDEEARKLASDNEEICKELGGIYIGKNTQDPNGPNKLDRGCYKQASDLTNPEACAAANQGFVWKQTGPNAFGCEDPSEEEKRKQQEENCADNGGYNPDTEECNDGTQGKGTQPRGIDPDALPKGECAGVQTNIITNCSETEPDKLIVEILKIGIQALSALIGVAAVGSIAWASVKYAKAEDNESDVKEAKDLIRNVIVGLIVYVLMIAIINWLVPGGVIG